MNSNNFNILIVDDELAYSRTLKKILSLDNYNIQIASNGDEALGKLKFRKYHLVITDLIMDGMSGIELLTEIKSFDKNIEVIIITGFGTVKNAVDAMKKGAYSYFIKGNDPEELLIEIKRLFENISLKDENIFFKSCIDPIHSLNLSSKNLDFKNTINIAKKAASSDVNILLLGESGVGKEVFAKFIHSSSLRSSKPFVPVNCHSFQESVLESELFGHEKGSFTGALESRIGRFESANSGTLFLDEIADTRLSTQVKLLRSIETKQIERLGSNQLIDIDFRLISATNKNINKLIEESEFREDFYYRISTIVIEIPPLRNRPEDIKDLADFFIKKSTIEIKKKINYVEPAVYEYLLNYDYPGNVRELKNIIERLVVLSDDGIISASDIPIKKSSELFKEKSLKEFRSFLEKEYIEKILIKSNYNMKETSRILGITSRQLFNKVSEYNLKNKK